MLFKLLKLRKNVKEVRKDPGGFAAGEAAGAVIETVLLVPGLIALFGLVLFFILGFTTLLGGPMGFFKFLFIFGVFVLLVIIAMLRPIIRLLKRGTKRAVDAGVRTIKEVTSEEV